MEFDGQIIFLILFVVISGIKWLIEQVKGRQNPESTSEALNEIYEEFREEIRQRQTQTEHTEQFEQPGEAFEAHLKAPTPPPIPGPTHQSPTTPPPVALKEVERPTLSVQEQAALNRLQQRQQQPNPTRQRGSTRDALINQLSSSDSVRQAILLQEILGKPKALRHEIS